MNNKLLIIFCAILFILVGCTNNNKQEKIKIGIIGNDYPIDRATVSKMLALANNSKSEILALDNVINFKDVDKDSWYNKYINCAYINKDISGVLEDKFEPEANLTITQTQYLINKYDKSKKIKIDDKNKDKPISYALWCNIYYDMVKDKNIEEDNLVILATKKTNKSLKDDYVITDKGLYSFEGIDVDRYIDTKIKVLKKDSEIIAITEVLELEPTLKRCYIEKTGNDFIDIFVGGARKRLYVKDKNIVIQDDCILADIKIKGNEILNIEYYKQTIRGVINRVDDNTIRLNNTNYVLDSDFTLYNNISNVSNANKNDLIIGQDIGIYFMKGNENKIYACIIDTPCTYKNIRVAINDSTYKNLYFDEIKLKSDSDLKVMVKGQEKNMQSLHIKNGADFSIGENEIIIIEASNKDEGIIFENIKRAYENVNFYGKLEVTKVKNKYLVINEIDIEKYIESVVATNSNGNKDLEMLKTLSIIYRTSAINYINENNLKHLGANLDDSSKYQGYNNRQTEDIFKQAVESTKGEIMLNGATPIKPTYFNYSAGVTGNSGEIWSDSKNYIYPTENKSHLLHIKDFTESIYENLQDEINANIFYKTKDIDSIEKNSKWFRWSTTLEQNEIAKINNNIKEIYKTEKYLIKTLDNNNYIYKPIDDIGKIKDINVRKRGEAGNIMELEIIGDKNTILLMGDNIIRKAFSLNSIINNNGELVQNINVLPSSYFVFDKIYDNNGYLKKITLYGGGYGHGVGLSIYGANNMAKEGTSYQEILTKYYSNIDIKNIY